MEKEGVVGGMRGGRHRFVVFPWTAFLVEEGREEGATDIENQGCRGAAGAGCEARLISSIETQPSYGRLADPC